MLYLCTVLKIKQDNKKRITITTNQKEMKTERTKTIGKIKGTSYRNTSYYGNPSYYVLFENETGETIKGYTSANAACGYSCTNSEFREFAYIEYHKTKSGKIVIDDILGKSTYAQLIASK